MNITVFGASGKVGRIVVEELRASGHSVTAFVHGSSPFESNEKLRIVYGDIHNFANVIEALDRSEAVISCLGSWGTKDKDILSSAMKNIIPAMEKQNIKRIISLTGSAAIFPGETLRLVDKLNRGVLSIVAGKILTDGENHLQQLVESNLRWTVIRSPVMKSSQDATYTLSLIASSPFATVSRNAVAKAMVDQLSETNFINAAPHIHSL